MTARLAFFGPTYALTGLLAASVLLLGGVHDAVVGALCVGWAAAVAAWGSQAGPRRAVGWALLAVTAVCGVQLVPLPPVAAAWLSPLGVSFRGDVAAVCGGGQRWMPFALEPAAAWRGLAVASGAVAAFLVAQVSAQRAGASSVLRAVLWICVAAALVLVLHKSAAMELVYGVYAPRYAGRTGGVSAPLLNPNHMAALLTTGALVGAGLAVKTSRAYLRWVYGAASVVCGGAVFLTLSRGGIASLLFGYAVFAVLLVWGRRKRRQRVSAAAWVAVLIGAAACGLGLLAVFDAVVAEYAFGDAKKLQLYAQTWELVTRYPWFGLGKGGFGVAFGQVSDWSTYAWFTHPENWLLQLAVDFGLPAALVLAVVFVWGWSGALSTQWQRPHRLGALAALAAFALHNMVDFAAELPGPGWTAAALLGVVSTMRGERRSAVRWGKVAWVAAAGVALGAWGALAVSRVHDLDRDVSAARMAVRDGDVRYFSDSRWCAALRWHPGSAQLFFLGGVHRYERGERSLPLFNAALVRNPHWAPAHLYAGRVLLRAGVQRQGLLELRTAVRLRPDLADEAARSALATVRDRRALAAIARTESDKRLLYDALAAELTRRGEGDAAARFDAALLRLDPAPVDAVAREALRRAAQERWEEAVDLIRRGVPPTSEDRYALIATVWMRAKRYDRVEAAVKPGLRRFPQSRRLLELTVWAQARAGRVEAAVRTLAAMRATVRTASESLRLVVLEGDVYAAVGKYHTAVARYRQANGLAPRKIGPLVRMEKAARLAGDVDAQLFALERLAQLDPQGPWTERYERVRKKYTPSAWKALKRGE